MDSAKLQQLVSSIIIIIIVYEIYRVLLQRLGQQPLVTLVQQRLVQERLVQERLVQQRLVQQRLV